MAHGAPGLVPGEHGPKEAVVEPGALLEEEAIPEKAALVEAQKPGLVLGRASEVDLEKGKGGPGREPMTFEDPDLLRGAVALDAEVEHVGVEKLLEETWIETLLVQKGARGVVASQGHHLDAISGPGIGSPEPARIGPEPNESGLGKPGHSFHEVAADQLVDEDLLLEGQVGLVEIADLSFVEPPPGISGLVEEPCPPLGEDIETVAEQERIRDEDDLEEEDPREEENGEAMGPSTGEEEAACSRFPFPPDPGSRGEHQRGGDSRDGVPREGLLPRSKDADRSVLDLVGAYPGGEMALENQEGEGKTCPGEELGDGGEGEASRWA
jgi:hypothetical protein